MLSYLDKHKDMFFEMIAKGIALPIYQIPTYQYPIFIITEREFDIRSKIIRLRIRDIAIKALNL